MKCQTEQDLIAGRMYANGRKLSAKSMTVLVCLYTDSQVREKVEVAKRGVAKLNLSSFEVSCFFTLTPNS